MADMQNDSTSRYAFLSALDVEQLEQLLKADYNGSMSEDAAEEFIDAIIEVMIEKERENPSGRLADVDKAWADFQSYYNVPDRNGQLLYPNFVSPDSAPSQKTLSRRSKRILRRAALVAVAIAIFTSLLVVAQAAGLDVFGAMARWTNETFYFVTTPTANEVMAFRSALEEQNIPVKYAPVFVPEDFCADKPQVANTKRCDAVSVRFSNGQEEFLFTVTQYHSKEFLDITEYEKDFGDAISYHNGHHLFYIFDNLENTVATWSDGDTYTIDIFGTISIDDMKSIINSIGG